MIFYKIGCYALILTGLLHLSSHFQEPVPANDTERQLLELMATYQVDVGGATITMNGILNGFGLWFSLALLWTGAMSLFLVKQLADRPALVRKIAIVNTGALALGTGLSFIYFFFIPTICLGVALTCFVLGVIRIKSN